MRSILIVCHGNICRSPMGESVFTHELSKKQPSIRVSSAGLQAVINSPPHSLALTTMQKYGIDISNHRACQITESMVSQSDLILVMTFNQKILLEQKFNHAKGKTFLLGHWHGFEIKDPLNQPIETFEKVYQQINEACHTWKARMLECTIA